MRIVLITFAYLPESVGGTEIYVSGLARELRGLGHEVHVAVPGASASISSDHVSGIPVHRIPPEAFLALLKNLEPQVVHAHPLYPADLTDWLLEARSLGIATFCTYHTPTLTCPRGDLLHWGNEVCDGTLSPKRCTECVLQQKGLPVWLAKVIPLGIGRPSPTSTAIPRKVRSMLGISGNCAQHTAEWQRLTSAVDHWVAVARWVADVLQRNGVDQNRITLSRQGLCDSNPTPAGPTSKTKSPSEPLRLGFLGRLHPYKGLHILLAAMNRIPDEHITLAIAGATHPLFQDYFDKLQKKYSSDSRIRWLGPVRPDDLHGFFQHIDLLVVPSVWLESGPMTILEAWAAGKPVLGADRGGIAEWVREYGGGELFPPGNSAELALRLKQLRAKFELGEFSSKLPEPRLIRDAALDMDGLYRSIAR